MKYPKYIDYSKYSEYNLSNRILESIYNLEQKFKFIKVQYGNQEIVSQQSVICFFSNTGFLEREFKKDLNQFNPVEIEDLFKKLDIRTPGTFFNRKSIIRQYMEWSRSENLITSDNIKGLDDFTFENLDLNDSYKKAYFKDFNDIKNGINEIVGFYNPIDEGQYAIVIIIICLRWFGLTNSQICKLKVPNINYENNSIFIDNTTFKIDEDVLKYISDYLKTDGYTTAASRGTKEYNYCQSEYVLRPLEGSSISCYQPKDIQVKVSNFTKVTDKLKDDSKYKNHIFSLKNIYDSGTFYRIYQYEKETGGMIDDFDKKTLSKLMKQNQLSQSKIYNFTSIYKIWKSTFYGI